MTDEIDYFEGNNKEVAEAEPMTLKRFMSLAEKARVLEQEIIDAGDLLSDKQDNLNKILRDLIPSAMKELGLQEFTLTDGSKIKVEEILHASLSEERKPIAFAWLEERNFDGIIKTNVNSSFGKGETEKAKEALKALTEAGFKASLERSIHAATLKSFVKERIEAGESIPFDVFGVHTFDQAKITRPKQRRNR